MTIDINFNHIRPHKGSKNKGFEELCCQLYSLEAPAPEARFIRKGGEFGDAGVECYWLLKDGTEHGLQAKYFVEFKTEQWKQIDESVKTALIKHPKLTKYVVCIPDNLHERRVTRKSGKKNLANMSYGRSMYRNGNVGQVKKTWRSNLSYGMILSLETV